MSTSSGETKFNVLVVKPQREILVQQYSAMLSAISALSSCYKQENPGFFLNKSGCSPIYDSVSDTYSSGLSSGSDLSVIGGALDKLAAQIQAIYDDMLLTIDTAIDSYGGLASAYANQLSAINDRLNELKRARGGENNE